MKNLLKKLSRDERGVSALEYAILAAVIVGAVVVGVGLFTDKLSEGFEALGTKVTDTVNGTGGTPPPPVGG